MKKITLKNKNITKEGFAPYRTQSSGSGFVILFAVMISSIILAIALGVANIALKEIKFSASVKDTNEAFFAADTGLECVLFNDKADGDSFVEEESSGTITCGGEVITLGGSFPAWDFVLSELGSSNRSCVKVTVEKDSENPSEVVMIAKGYNVGGIVAGACNPGANSVERQLEVNYNAVSIWADIKANNSDGPISVPVNSEVDLTWDSAGVSSCVITKLSNGVELGSSTSGSYNIAAHEASSAFEINCDSGEVVDEVQVDVS